MLSTLPTPQHPTPTHAAGINISASSAHNCGGGNIELDIRDNIMANKPKLSICLKRPLSSSCTVMNSFRKDCGKGELEDSYVGRVGRGGSGQGVQVVRTFDTKLSPFGRKPTTGSCASTAEPNTVSLRDLIKEEDSHFRTPLHFRPKSMHQRLSSNPSLSRLSNPSQVDNSSKLTKPNGLSFCNELVRYCLEGDSQRRDGQNSQPQLRNEILSVDAAALDCQNDKEESIKIGSFRVRPLQELSSRSAKFKVDIKNKSELKELLSTDLGNIKNLVMGKDEYKQISRNHENGFDRKLTKSILLTSPNAEKKKLSFDKKVAFCPNQVVIIYKPKHKRTLASTNLPRRKPTHYSHATRTPFEII